MIKWYEHFNVVYIRKIDRIKKHSNQYYGHIENGEYLTEKQTREDFPCQEGELYVVCEKMLNNCYVYHIVYIQNNGPLVLFTTDRHTGYPWHENELVAYILRNKALLQSIEVL